MAPKLLLKGKLALLPRVGSDGIGYLFAKVRDVEAEEG